MYPKATQSRGVAVLPFSQAAQGEAVWATDRVAEGAEVETLTAQTTKQQLHSMGVGSEWSTGLAVKLSCAATPAPFLSDSSIWTHPPTFGAGCGRRLSEK